jgi:hypothetical protein
MKKLLYLLAFSILFQICYSYKSIDYNKIDTEKNQKFEVLMLNKTSVKGRLVSKNEKTMTLQTKEGEGIIPVEEIYNVKVRNFSFLKSVGLAVAVPILAYIGAVIVVVIILVGM